MKTFPDIKETRTVYGDAVADFLGIIYLISNNVTGEVYVGQTINGLYERWRKHCQNEESALFLPVAKYGSANFTLSILEVCYSFDTLNVAEIKWLEKFRKSHRVYNIVDGGKNAPKPKSVRDKISVSHSGKVFTLTPKPMKTIRKTDSLRGICNERAVVGTHLDSGESLELKSMSCDSRFDPRLISACCKGKRRSHRRFAWRYRDE